MFEVIAGAAGIVLGFLLTRTGTRAAVLTSAAGAVVIGSVVATVSGELEISAAFLFFDIGQVFAAAIVSRAAMRMIQRSRNLRTRPR